MVPVNSVKVKNINLLVLGQVLKKAVFHVLIYYYELTCSRTENSTDPDQPASSEAS